MLKRRNITGKKILKMLSTLANLTPWSNAPISSFRLFNSEPGNRKQSFEWITVKLFLFFSCDAFFFSCELKCAVCNILLFLKFIGQAGKNEERVMEKVLNKWSTWLLNGPEVGNIWETLLNTTSLI